MGLWLDLVGFGWKKRKLNKYNSTFSRLLFSSLSSLSLDEIRYLSTVPRLHNQHRGVGLSYGGWGQIKIKKELVRHKFQWMASAA